MLRWKANFLHFDDRRSLNGNWQHARFENVVVKSETVVWLFWGSGLCCAEECVWCCPTQRNRDLLNVFSVPKMILYESFESSKNSHRNAIIYADITRLFNCMDMRILCIKNASMCWVFTRVNMRVLCGLGYAHKDMRETVPKCCIYAAFLPAYSCDQGHFYSLFMRIIFALRY